MINIWFLLGPVPTYRMGNGCNAIQNRLSSGRAFVCFACYLCVWVCFCEYKGPVTACVWPGEIKEQIGLQITTAPRHHSEQWPLSDYRHHHQQWPWTQRSSLYGLWRDIMYRFRRKELHAAGWDALVALKDLCSCEEKKIYITRW